jgi:hypothetical protein
MLVYQAGIANVFAVRHFGNEPEARYAKRLIQGDFSSCINFARGLMAAGATVMTAACNQAGDIAASEWTMDLESQPFAEKLVKLETPVNADTCTECGAITD